MNDTTRLSELDQYQAQVSRAVKERDFEGYKGLYHKDAILVFTSSENKRSVPIAKAFITWEKGFHDTKEGKQTDTVEFRFSQRIGDETTAHETGIFLFTSVDEDGKVKAKHIVHFEMLLIKKQNDWLGLMEYQKLEASQEEWEALPMIGK